jgi:hypothetical protein
MKCNCEKIASLKRLVEHYTKMVDLKSAEYTLLKTDTIRIQLERYKRLLELSQQALDKEIPSETCECALQKKAERERLEEEKLATQRKYQAYDATVVTVAQLVENDTKLVQAVNNLQREVGKIKNNYDPLKK